jgi:Protein of unknown function (DUF1761)
MPVQTPKNMLSAFHQLNYFPAVLGATIAGFLFGAIWYSLLFGKAWRVEMKIPPGPPGEEPSMVPGMIKGFICTFISTVALAWVIALAGTMGMRHGAALGAGLGLLLVGARYANNAIWERKSCKLIAINVGHEVLMFAIQGAILARWLP